MTRRHTPRCDGERERLRNERMQRQFARELGVEARRSEAETERKRKREEREARDAHREARTRAAEQRTEDVEARVAELQTVLRRAVARPPLTVADLARVRLVPFDPGADGEPRSAPWRPVMEDGGWFGRGARRRAFEHEVVRYQQDHARWEAEEHARQGRVEARRAAHEREESARRSAARRRAAHLSAGVGRGEGAAIEEFVGLVLGELPIPSGVDLNPSVAYRSDPREVVVDIRLPDDEVVPVERSRKYVQSRDHDIVLERPKSEREAIYRALLAQLPLAVADAVFRALDPQVVESVAVSGKLNFVDPATGRRKDDFLVSVIVGREALQQRALGADELDPVLCVRELGARLSPHPLARESVPAFLSFDEAKYKLGTSVDVAGDLDARSNLGTMPWSDFEQLVRELLLAMYGRDTRVTRGSRDEGIDGVIFDCDAAIGGEYIVQAKRYRNVVPAGDVRALAGTMHDKRANHALFVTTAWFSPDGRRFAKDNRVRLIEGPELRRLLLEHLDLDVLIPSQRSRK